MQSRALIQPTETNQWNEKQTRNVSTGFLFKTIDFTKIHEVHIYPVFSSLQSQRCQKRSEQPKGESNSLGPPPTRTGLSAEHDTLIGYVMLSKEDQEWLNFLFWFGGAVSRAGIRCRGSITGVGNMVTGTAVTAAVSIEERDSVPNEALPFSGEGFG